MEVTPRTTIGRLRDIVDAQKVLTVLIANCDSMEGAEILFRAFGYLNEQFREDEAA